MVLVLPLLVACGSLDYVFPETAQAAKLTSANTANHAARSAHDNDGDGVPDWADICGASTAEILVNSEGCEIVTGVVEGLEFAPDDVMLSIDAKSALDKIVSAFRRYPDVMLSVTSHTDNRGSAADNLALSKQRLNAVVTYMISSGIEAQRIKPFAYGESRPIAPNATLDGRERNRRIEIEVIERLL